MSKTNNYVNSLLEFLDNSPCNFLAVDKKNPDRQRI